MTSDVSTTAPEVAAASIGVMSDMDAAATRGPKVRGASWSDVFFFFFCLLGDVWVILPLRILLAHLPAR